MIETNKTNHWYTLSLSAVHPRIFHFEIDEKHPLSERYRVRHALAENFISREILVDEITDQKIVISEGDKTAIVQADPFRIDFYYGGTLMTSVNANGQLQFEHLRLKPENPPEGEWEEEFNGFVDSKSRGPESTGLDFTFPQADVLYGIPEHADDFILKDTTKGDSDPYRLYNLDVNSYVVNSKMALYGSVPVLYGHGVDGSSGLFWQNAAETWVDIVLGNAPSANFISESGIIDVFILLGTSPIATFRQFAALTGSAPLPQMYALGYHQSRWNYDNDSDVAMIDSKFTEHSIPLDSVWLDIEYTDEKRYFTWDHARFPNPLEMINNLTENDRHLTVIIDPHVKVDEYYFFHKNCTANDYYVKDKDRNDYQGWCWPGLSSYTDFVNPHASKYYADQFLLTNFKESTREVGLWNDMNEPSVFNGPEITMQKDNIHFGGWEHRDIHNIFGHYHVMATHDGLIRRSEGAVRPFVLTRAFFAGTQRYAAVWTGDNTAEWSHMQASIKMCLSLSVSGISFCGADVGGFFNDPSAELIARWYQLGAFQPFFRGHSHEATHRREPWLWPEETKQIIRSAIEKRYRLLPFLYTLFYEHERFGRPVMRPLLAHYPWDPKTFRLETQYLIGDQLLVAPVLEAGQRNVNVYFPLRNDSLTEIWYDLDNYNKYIQSGYVEIPVDSNKIPVFQRGGTIIPTKSTVRKSTVAMRGDPYTLLVALDARGHARGELYVDDEQSFEYRYGKYQYLEIEFYNKVLSLRKIDTDAFLNKDIVIDRIVIAGLAGVSKTAKVYSASGTKRKAPRFWHDAQGTAVKNPIKSSTKRVLSIGFRPNVPAVSSSSMLFVQLVNRN
ncbi:neutral alpha-glucosidase ab [Culex quinquefasciatus]|uniref:Glucosidase II subunit alpha n=1 Tax=Culex quinquefasciatus TaxID=7176 RepID=B0WQR7_CULQU|nr:neutral alpha-glucosidase ab [Culex quinquefasciatus]|eukprot:XP_001851051.1 neutral alpha-glucosidase ab [Culex quinquefasciatus]